jgi:dienelactone hydrolase
MRILLFALLLTACASGSIRRPGAARASATAGIPATEQIAWVPVQDDDGTPRTLWTRLCLPQTDQRSRVVIINHGSPASAADRPKVRGYACDSEPAQWFLSRGYLVVSPVRRGYGLTGGKWSETPGPCDHPDFTRAGLETARDIAAVVDFTTQLSQALPDQAVVIGQSAGGWGTLAYNSIPHPKVTALIDMAGGRGGHKGGKPNQNCSPQSLVESAGAYGKSAGTPMLWIYAANDSFFDPQLARSIYDSFVAGGGKAELKLLGPFGADGHSLFGSPGGSGIWGPWVDLYLSGH